MAVKTWNQVYSVLNRVLNRKGNNIYLVLLDFKNFIVGSFLTPSKQNGNVYVYAAKACFNILNKSPEIRLTNIFLFK